MEKSVALLNMNGPLEKTNNISDQDVLFYDHDCIMCSHFIGFINKIYPTLLFSKTHSECYKNLDLNPSIDSVVFYFSGKIYIKSDAVFLLLIQSKSKKWKVIGFIIKLIPKKLRDFMYDIIAKYRKQISKFFFKNNFCNISIKNI